MAAGGDPDFNSVVECLVNMFDGVINRDAIVTIVESCGGDLNYAADVVMRITNDSGIESKDAESKKEVPVAESNTEATLTHTNVPAKCDTVGIPTNPEDKQKEIVTPTPSSSYSKAIQNASQAQKPAPRNQPESTTSAGQYHGPVSKSRTTPVSPSKVPWNDQLRRIVENHNRGYRILILMRGAPGSGKTHLAQNIVEMLIGGTNVNFKTHICSTDDYFVYRGQYHFNKNNLSEAHSWNQSRVKEAMLHGLSPIIIDNTNIEVWELEFYVRNGVEHGYILEVVEPKTPWSKKPNQLARRNVHNVPLHTIRRMIENYVDNITGDWLLKYFRLRYPHDRTPPVLRRMPPFQQLESKPCPDSENASEKQVISQIPIHVTDDTGRDINIINDLTHIEKEMVDTGTSSSHNDTAKESVSDDTEIVESSVQNQEQENHDNDCFDDFKYSELLKQLDEINKVEDEWENGESWEEIQMEPTSATSGNNNNIEKNPKPQRPTSPNPGTNENLINAVNNCQDWTRISLFMPPWRDEDLQSLDAEENIIETRCSSTCMESGDFDWNKTPHKVISATSRNINQYHISFGKEKIPEKRMLDKSTMTNELLLTDPSKRCKNEESHFIAFRRLFKNVSKAALRDIFDQCMGDVNWAVEIVLDGVATQQIDTVEDEDDTEDENVDNHELCTCLSSYQVIPDSSSGLEVGEQDSMIVAPIQPPSIVPKRNSKREVKTSDASPQLKRQIEQNVFIAENHYSEHCLKLRKWRHGEYLTDEEVQIKDENQPSTSQGLQSSKQVVPCINESAENSDDESSSSASMEEPEKTVNINLGREFVVELDALFGRTDMSYPEFLMPKINIPVSLLNEINALWMESLMHQLDEHERQAAKILQEDEEFARVLAMKEAELAVVGKQPEVLDFKEIMDMDYAISLYQRDVAEWKNKEPNDLAAKLTREKLYNLFPEVPKEVLAELLMAHDNSFQSTVEVLLVSTGQADLLQEKNGINNFVTQREMERQKLILEKEKQALSEVEWPLLPNGEVPDMEVVNSYRDTADRHLKSRDQNIQKASEYVRRGMLTVGGYYRQLAEFHKLKYEQSNSLAAASLMQIHAAKCPDSATIDLHYLRVGEAKESLDLFIDTHIQKLKSLQGVGAKHHTLYFITGRGRHSPGRPRVKPAVKKRLRERGLHCSEVNPGLLSAKVCADDKLTHQVA